MDGQEKLFDYLKKASAELQETRKRLRRMEMREEEPIAIVGMGCRYAGGVRDPEGLWRLVDSGTDAMGGFPDDRGWEAFGTAADYAQVGAFVYDATDFDADFFGISPREALAMEPQQRLLLEVSWEAIEEAGLNPLALRGSHTGVFVGAAFSNYGTIMGEGSGSEGYVMTGSLTAVISGRVSYTLGLEGPAVTVDTACSSSLVALHLACQSLRAGECTLALGGGVAVMALPGAFAEFSRQNGMAADGRCKAFAGAADGIGWGEGAGVLVLEKLSDARRNGHRVHAVIRGSAINQDGASNGLTAPSGPSQQRVIRDALANARLSAAMVDAVEGHGTGTTLGDPIEAHALIATYGQDRPDGSPLWLGSVKSNIGHTQAAAGVAGVLKMALALKHGVLPRTLHVDEPSPYVDWSAGDVRLLTEPVPWPAEAGRPRRAAVSAFGVSGTNAHFILEEAPSPLENAGPGPLVEAGPAPVLAGARGPLAWVVSGKSEEALAAQAGRLANWVAARPGLDPADVSWSLATGRAALEHRAVVTGSSVAELTAGLAWMAGEQQDQAAPAGVVTGVASAVGNPGRTVFVFPGQGGQWAGMGVELAGVSPVFAARLGECSAALEPVTGWRVEDVLAGVGGAPDLERVDVVQPVLWAVMVALAAVWEAAGVVPDAVAGHSQGEIAAAVVAGVLSVEDGARVVALRSRALRALAGRGGMVSVAEPVGRVRERLVGWGGRLSVAAVNGPSATVVSGDPAGVAELAAVCVAQGVRARVLPVDYASHSAQVEGLRGEIVAALGGVVARRGVVPMVSAVSGEWVEGPELGGGYWYESLRAPVEFERVVRGLVGEGFRAFVEVSAHPVLTGAIEAAAEAAGAPGAGVVVSGTLRRDDGGPGRLLASLAGAHVSGVTVDWARVLPAAGRVDLPTYAFQHHRYWPVPGALGGVAGGGLHGPGHPLLGSVVELAGDGGLVGTGRLSLRSQPWLGDHLLGGVCLFPAAAYVELALAAGRQAGCEVVEELMLETPLVLPADGAVQVQVSVGGAGPDGLRAVEVHTRPADGGAAWVRHARGTVGPGSAEAGFPEAGDFLAWPPEGAEPVDVSGLYEALAAAGGVEYGPAFRGLRAAWRRGDDVFAEVELPAGDGPGAGAFALHPALLDAALQASVLGGGEEGGRRMPFAWAGVSLLSAGASVLRARLRPAAGGGLSLAAADAAGTPVVSVRSLVQRPVGAEQLRSAAGTSGRLFAEEWIKVSASAADPSGHRWAVIGADRLGLTEGLTRAGASVTAYADVAAFGAALAAGEAPPGAVLACAGFDVAESPPGGPGTDDPAAGARQVTGHVLSLLKDWLADEPLDVPLVIATRGASRAVPAEGVADLAAASAWGLVRSAQREHPGRLILVDLPPVTSGDEAGEPAGAGAAEATSIALLAATPTCGEPELAIRGRDLLARRLRRAAPPDAQGRADPADPQTTDAPRTVLVTGGTGTLGGLVATHLAATGRAGRLLLASRSGPAAPGAAELAGRVAAAGASVLIGACDVGDAGALGALLAGVPADRPLTGVVHTAGVVADGVIESLDQDRVDVVMRAKADAAWSLHALTRDADLRYFVLFSSAAATIGAPGQGNYSAANAFLDALAAARRAAGLPAMSLAWGPWVAGQGIGRDLSQGLLDRVTRSEMVDMSGEEGLALFDHALTRDEAVLVPAQINVAELRAQAAAGREFPSLLRGLTGGAGRSSTAGDTTESLRGKLAGLSPDDQERMLTALVRTHAAAVLGHPSPEAVEPGRAFADLGFDSLTAVELRNRLHAATGLRLPTTLIFDHPSPATLAQRLREELAGVLAGPAEVSVPRAVRGEPIAIVGIGCRFPGGIESPEQLWDLLIADGDAISGLPEDRGWNLAAYPGTDLDGGISHVRGGGFLAGAAGFDPGFFGISPREALVMDPQQRLLLETSWEALERAGIDPLGLRGSRTGVFAGAAPSGYGSDLVDNVAGSAGYLVLGSATSVLTGRVSYLLGLEGPSVSLDTACSSSMVALHLAVQALQAGECSLALAGGVTIMATPLTMLGYSQQGAMSADGRCKPFSSTADGVGMGEGAAMLVVERLSDARRHGHPVLAVIAGSAVNSDGASNGLTAPNGPSQQRVIQAALANAGLTAGQVDAVEAHGTGTKLGDPIEAQAIIATYGQGRPADRPLWLGSVKSNIGHTQHAAGAAGLIKMILALQHETLPRTLHVEEPSPHVEWSAGHVRLLTEPMPWPAGGDQPRRVGISSFGMSGTNAHVILADPPAVASRTEAEPAADAGGTVLTSGPAAWVVSGKTAAALAAQAGRLADWAASRPGLDPADAAWSLATTRSTFEHRAVVTATGRDELVAGLAALAAGKPARNVVSGAVPASGHPGETVFVFPGQGTQWAGMGVELAEASPVFAARLAECSSALEPLTGWRVEDMLANALALERAEVVQPVLWAVMVSLAAVWEAAGVTPAAVIGHSQGEIAAATVAGILSLADAARVVALRSRAMRALAGKGGMASLSLPVDAVRERMAAWPGRLSVAAVNSPSTTVVSGDPAAIELLVAACKRDGVRTLVLPADCAGHSPQVEALEAEVTAALAGIEPGPARIPMVSTMTGRWLDGPELDAAYWYTSMRAPVEFERSVRALTESGHRVFIEVSPHPVLASSITEIEHGAVVTGTLRNGRGGAGRVLASLGQAHVAGVKVDWTRVLPAGRKVELPTYAFQHQHFWPQPAPAAVGGAVAGGDGAEAGFWAAVEDGDLSGLADVLAVDTQRPFSEVVPALASWRHRERAESALARWRYQVTWAPVTGSGSARLAGPWLLLVPAGHEARADEVAAAMTANGARLATIMIEAGQADRDELAGLIGAALTGEAPAGVVSLLALDESPLAGEPALPAGMAGTLALVQALGDAGIDAPLWVLTSGAVGVRPGEAPARPVQAMAWGFGRVAALEHPDRWGGLVDLPPGLDQRAGRRLSMLLAGCGEDQAAIREAGVYGRRMTRAAAARSAAAWKPGGSALITGGTGGIGGHVARWLASRGTPRVILTSRSGPAASGAATLAADLAAAGTTVQVCVCDSASKREAAGLLARTAASGPPLAAVFHAAGVPQATPIAEMSRPGLAGVLAAKTTGAACLDELTRDLDLEAFVLFSSGAATWGSGEQSGYAAANAYLDALAEERRARGLAATSTAWGGWAGEGMITAEGAFEGQRRGIGQMDPHLAVQALAQVVDAGENAITIADVDWARFTPAFTIRRPSPLLSALPEAADALAGDTVPGEDAADALAGRLAGLPPAEQEQILTDLVRGEVAVVLGHASAQAVEPDQAFADLGFDSVTAIEFRNRLGAASGLQLPATLVYDHPTPVALAQYLRTQSGEYRAHYELVIEEIGKLESSLSLATWDHEEKLRISTRLDALARGLRATGAGDPADVQEFDPATDDEMFDLVDEELRISDIDQ